MQPMTTAPPSNTQRAIDAATRAYYPGQRQRETAARIAAAERQASELAERQAAEAAIVTAGPATAVVAARKARTARKPAADTTAYGVAVIGNGLTVRTRRRK